MATIDDAILAVVRGPGTPEEKAKIIQELTTAAPTDRWTMRYVIWGLVALVLVIAIGAIVLLGINKTPIPEGIIALGSMALGALAAYLVPPGHPTAMATPAEPVSTITPGTSTSAPATSTQTTASTPAAAMLASQKA